MDGKMKLLKKTEIQLTEKEKAKLENIQTSRTAPHSRVVRSGILMDRMALKIL